MSKGRKRDIRKQEHGAVKHFAAPIVQAAVQERLQVAAIDFGTTYSGYAFQFLSDFKKDPLKIAASQWESRNRTVSLKTPTCALFKPNGDFQSFGFDAEDKYAELALGEMHRTWFYFKHFKMKLYENDALNRKLELTDDKGLKMPALKVFSACIKYLKDHMLNAQRLKEKKVMREDDIHWVLTVPAIWQDNAKQFMREAAIDAGLRSDRLTLALEPEAASLFCRYLPLTKIKSEEGSSITCFEPKKKYMILDAGGGTVDITVHETHEVFERGRSGDMEISGFLGAVSEVCRANGGPWGGVRIDEAYLEMLNSVVGKDVMEKFAERYTDDFLDMFRDFEIKKTIFNEEDKVTFRIPSSINELYKEMKGQDFRRSLMMKQSLKDNITFTGDKLRTKPDQIKHLFTSTCEHIVNHLEALFQKPEVEGTDTIVMVGGFSDSRMLQSAVRKAFPKKSVIVPEDAGLAVLKGAVIFGHNPSAIVARVSQRTYGIKANSRFKEGKHDISRRFTDAEDGVVRCKGCFSKHVEIDQKVKVGEVFEEQSYKPGSIHTKIQHVSIISSTKKEPLYADEPDVKKIGALKIDLSDLRPTDHRYIKMRMIYGNTELGVEARVVKTGQVVKASFDFLA